MGAGSLLGAEFCEGVGEPSASDVKHPVSRRLMVVRVFTFIVEQYCTDCIKLH